MFPTLPCTEESSRRRLAEHQLAIQEHGVTEKLVISIFLTNAAREGELCGLSFASKGNMDYAGHITSLGIKPALWNLPAKTSAAIIRTLESHGARCLCSTNCDELCADFQGTNQFFGDMLNPLAPELSPLGSSTGSAICVAKDYVDFALGTDFGGSVRAPAAAVGIYGLKLPSHWFDQSGIFLYSQTLDCLGILAKSSQDLATLVHALTPQKISAPTNDQRIVFVAHSEDLASLSSDYRVLFDKALRVLADTFSIQEAPPLFKAGLHSRKVLAIRDMALTLAAFKDQSHRFPPGVQAVLKRSETLSSSEIEDAQHVQLLLRSALDRISAANGALLSPTLPCLPPSRVAQSQQHPGPANFYLALANLTDRAALTIPLKKFPSGTAIPFSLQLLAGAQEMAALLQFAQRLEQVFS